MLNKLFKAKIPMEFDIRLQPLTDANPNSYGFPSIETYMSVIIFGHFLIAQKVLYLWPIAAIIILFIGFTRLYSKSRFPHQIIGSMILGFVGLFGGIEGCNYVEFHK